MSTCITGSHSFNSNNIFQVSDVQLEKNQDVFSGTLHLTDHNLIFSHSEDELWVCELCVAY
jgi:hypothetical protein